MGGPSEEPSNEQGTTVGGSSYRSPVPPDSSESKIFSGAATAVEGAPSLDGSTDVESQAVPYAVLARQRMDAMTAASWAKLSAKAKALADLPEMRRQEGVHNSAMVFTEPFANLIVSRLSHQIHAASQVHRLREVQKAQPHQMDLTDYEMQVLEIVLLLHDFGHVPGSHATDRVFAAMAGAPNIGKLGYNPVDYHEFHGAQELGRGRCSERVRGILGEELFGDVMAVLTHADKRPLEEKNETYGVFNPSLPPDRLRILHVLEDLFDRSSFVLQDIESGGYEDEDVGVARSVVDQFLTSIRVDHDTVSIIKTEDRDPYQSLIQLRAFHFANVPMHPTNGLVSAVLQWAASREFAKLGLDGGEQAYKWARDTLLDGRCGDVFGPVWNELSTPGRCVTDRMAPLVTLTKADLSQAGRSSTKIIREREQVLNDDCSYPGRLVNAVAGGAFYDVSFLELRIREGLKESGFGNIPVFILVAPVLDKEFNYSVTTADGTTERTIPPSIPDLNGYVVIAAEAVDSEGRTRDLSGMQAAVEGILNKSGWLKDGLIAREKYKPRVFVDPLYEGVFRPDVDEERRARQPAWMQEKGASGLIGPSNYLSTKPADYPSIN